MSIIIPACNTAQYIHRAIKSSLRQTHKNIEIIIVDDGSTDDTLNVARGYAEEDERIKIFTQVNAGVSAARNRGISEARGEYLYFLDSDDWLEDEAIEVMLDAQAKYPDRLIAANFYDVTQSRGRFYGVLRHETLHTGIMSVDDVAEIFFTSKGAHNLHAKIFRTDIIKDNGLWFRTGIHYGEDGEFLFRYVHKTGGKFFVDRPLENVLCRQGSAMHSPFSKRKQENEDPIQLEIAHPSNSDITLKWLKLFHTECMSVNLSHALFGASDSGKIQELRTKAGKYLQDYMHSPAVSMRRKAKLYCRIFLPITAARCTEAAFKLYSLVNISIRKLICPARKIEIFPPAD